MTRHILKIWPSQFKLIWDGKKTFEVRRNDRNYQEGDRLLLREWDPQTELYSGREVACNVPYILRGAVGAISEGSIVMSIVPTRHSATAKGETLDERTQGIPSP